MGVTIGGGDYRNTLSDIEKIHIVTGRPGEKRESCFRVLQCVPKRWYPHLHRNISHAGQYVPPWPGSGLLEFSQSSHSQHMISYPSWFESPGLLHLGDLPENEQPAGPNHKDSLKTVTVDMITNMNVTLLIRSAFTSNAAFRVVLLNKSLVFKLNKHFKMFTVILFSSLEYILIFLYIIICAYLPNAPYRDTQWSTSPPTKKIDVHLIVFLLISEIILGFPCNQNILVDRYVLFFILFKRTVFFDFAF